MTQKTNLMTGIYYLLIVEAFSFFLAVLLKPDFWVILVVQVLIISVWLPLLIYSTKQERGIKE